MDQPSTDNAKRSNPYPIWMECICGHCFDASLVGNFRGAGGKYLNRDVERAAIDNRIEVQCPKCGVWLDTLKNDIVDDL